MAKRNANTEHRQLKTVSQEQILVDRIERRQRENGRDIAELKALLFKNQYMPRGNAKLLIEEFGKLKPNGGR
jgi:hypothetical protein